MRVLGINILIAPKEEKIKKTKGGFETTGEHRDEERYGKATVLHLGESVVGVKVGDEVVYDIRAGHFIDLEGHDDPVRIITSHDIKLILDVS